MSTVDPPTAPATAGVAWPGALLVTVSGQLAILTNGGVARRGPESVTPTPAPHEGAVLFVDHHTGRAGALGLDLAGPRRDLGPATRILGSTTDRHVLLEEHTPEPPLADPYDVEDEWEYQERLAGTYGGRNVVRAVSLDSGATGQDEVHRQDLRDPNSWAALCALHDGRLVLTRHGPSAGMVLLSPDGRREPYGYGRRFLGTAGGALLVTTEAPWHSVLLDPVTPPGTPWWATAPAGWRVLGPTAVLPNGAVLCALHEGNRPVDRCLALAEPGGNLVPVPGSRGAQPDQVGLAIVDDSTVVFGGLRPDGASWYAVWTAGSGRPATHLPVTEQLAWLRPRLLAAVPPAGQ